MKAIKSLATHLLALSLFPGLTTAESGEPVTGKPETKNPVADALLESEPTNSELTVVMPGWMAGIEGTIGVQGIDTMVDVGFDDIVKNLNMIAAARLEGRHGKLGFILEGIYIETSVGGATPGPLLSSVSLTTEQLLAEGALTYRLFESDRGWLEFLAGARYIYLNNELTLNIDSAGVARASQDLSREIIERATRAAKDEAAKQLPGLVSALGDKAADLRASATNEIERRVQSRVDEVHERIRDRIDDGIGSPDPRLGIAIARRGAIRNAVRDYVNAQVAAEVELARAKASAAVAAARVRVRRQVERRLEKAEAELAKAIEKEISDRIPKSPVAASKAWVDPFVGFRGRYQLTDDFYTVARGDIGGFGVSSQLTWNVYGALGFALTERTAVELGYRYLQIDYQSGGFSYDVATKGPFLGVRIDF